MLWFLFILLLLVNSLIVSVTELVMYKAADGLSPCDFFFTL